MVSVFRHTFVVMASLCALGLVPGSARGQTAALPPENDPLLQALIEEALARSPDLHAAQSAISAAQTATERARVLPDPMVSMTYTNDGWAPSLGSMPMTTLGFMVSQSLPYSGKRDLRASLAASQARQAEPALAIETSTAAAAVARRDLKPDFSVQGGYMNRGGLDAMWLAGVGISWPFNKKARESAVAEAEIRAKGGSHVVESVGLQLAYKTRERFTRAKALEKLVALYDGGIIPQDQMTVEATLTSYQTGKVPFVSVLEAMTALYADRWARAGLVADHARLRASLREASLDGGSEMSPASSPAAGTTSAGLAGGMTSGMSGK